MIRKSDMSSDPGQGMNYWRSLQELADTDEYRNQLGNEVPSGVDAPGGMTRRRFLQVMSASIAMTLVFEKNFENLLLIKQPYCYRVKYARICWCRAYNLG